LPGNHVQVGNQYYRVSRSDVWQLATLMDEYLIVPYMGRIWGFVYEVIVNFAVANICLAVFNLLPVPPLDGYHVLNDLLLKKSLFASYKVMQIGRAVLLVLVMTGWLGEGLSWAVSGLFDAIGRLAMTIAGC